MKYIYIAAPYSKCDPVTNTRDVIIVADDLMLFGYIPFVPHITLFWHFLNPHDINYWYKYDIAWLEKCDCLLRLPGESPGADNEDRIAKELGMPVYYSVDEAIAGLSK